MLYSLMLTTALAATDCSHEREYVKREFTKTYADPVRAAYDRLFALMPTTKKEEAARLRERLGEAQRRLAAVKAADPKMSEILAHGDEGQRAFETMRTVKSEQRRYATEINELKHKMNVILSDYITHNLDYLSGVAREARKSGLDVTIDRRAWDVKILAVSKTVVAPADDVAGHQVSQSYWTVGGEPQVEVTGSERARERAGSPQLSVEGYADYTVSPGCRAPGLNANTVNYFEHHGIYQDGAAVIKSSTTDAER